MEPAQLDVAVHHGPGELERGTRVPVPANHEGVRQSRAPTSLKVFGLLELSQQREDVVGLGRVAPIDVCEAEDEQVVREGAEEFRIALDAIEHLDGLVPATQVDERGDGSRHHAPLPPPAADPARELSALAGGRDLLVVAILRAVQEGQVVVGAERRAVEVVFEGDPQRMGQERDGLLRPPLRVQADQGLGVEGLGDHLHRRSGSPMSSAASTYDMPSSLVPRKK